MSDSEMRIIEINGIKVEVDLRTAKRVDVFRVGTRVKLLKKKEQYSASKVYSGIIIGFEPFDSLPTIIVCYVEVDYSAANLKFIHINSETEEWELIPSIDKEVFDRESVERHFRNEEEKLEKSLAEIREKQAYFQKTFGKYWGDVHVSGAGSGEED